MNSENIGKKSIPSNFEEDNDMDIHRGRAMFGDVFGDRGDYSKGTFYSHRRKYLVKEANGNYLLRPPDFVMTRIQSKRFNKKSQQVTLQNKFDFGGVKEEDSTKKNKNIISKKTVHKKFINIIKFSSTNPDDWEERTQAGCKIWINSNTGEVSDECPWEDGHLEFNSKNLQQAGPEFGCGSLVYDSKELNEMFSYLDSSSK